jgi:acetyltransferase
VTLKLSSPEVIHKTEARGIRVSLKDETEGRQAFRQIVGAFTSGNPGKRLDGVMVQEQGAGAEMIIGMLSDQQFGPVLMCGLGGIFVEILRDVTQGIAPLDRDDVERMVRSIRAYPMLAGARGKRPGDIPALVEVILKVSQMAMEFPELEELEMNPVMVGDEGTGVTAVDALVTIKGEQ